MGARVRWRRADCGTGRCLPQARTPQRWSCKPGRPCGDLTAAAPALAGLSMFGRRSAPPQATVCRVRSSGEPSAPGSVLRQAASETGELGSVAFDKNQCAFRQGFLGVAQGASGEQRRDRRGNLWQSQGNLRVSTGQELIKALCAAKAEHEARADAEVQYEFFETSGNYGKEKDWQHLLLGAERHFDTMGVALQQWRKDSSRHPSFLSYQG